MNGETESELDHILAECIWWLIILGERMNIDISEALKNSYQKLKNIYVIR